MRRRLCLIALLACASPAVRAADFDSALEDFKRDFNSSAFSNPRLSNNRQLILDAADPYLSAKASKRKEWVQDALTRWREALSLAGVNKKTTFLEVVWPAGGCLWQWDKGALRQLDEWSDEKLAFSETNRSGRLFGFFGGQLVTGGASQVNGLNARLGSTLFHDRYDLALSYSHTTVKTTPQYVSNTYGLVGRALFPWTKQAGWNIGGQATRTLVPGAPQKYDALSALTGINFYLPGGSFDVTLTWGEEGAYGLQLGYTLFFNKP